MSAELDAAYANFLFQQVPATHPNPSPYPNPNPNPHPHPYPHPNPNPNANPEQVPEKGEALPMGKGRIIKTLPEGAAEGSRVAILSIGTRLAPAVEAARAVEVSRARARTGARARARART